MNESDLIYAPQEGVQAAFFDMDGVLSIPRYRNGGRLLSGGSFAWWRAYNGSGAYTYADCLRPRGVYELVNGMRAAGIEVYVLSVEAYADCRPNKLRFAREQYDFDEAQVIFVDHSEDKVPYLERFAAERGFAPEQLYFMDDTYPLVLHAVTIGIDAHHISELLAVG